MAVFLMLMFAVNPCYATAGSCQSLVHEAQIMFTSATTMYKQGHKDMAAQVFVKSHEFLLAAEAQAPASLRGRLNTIFAKYYKNLHVIEPALSQELSLARTVSHATFTADDIEQGQIHRHIHSMLANNRAFLMSGMRRAHSYLPMIQEEFARHGLPANLAYLAFIESCFEPEALSSAGARGMWQFMPDTARAYGLEVSEYMDERLDPVKSTTAAARYLKKLYAQFGNWPLAMAAYNCGENRLSKALQSIGIPNNTSSYGASSFWDLVAHEALPAETRDYVPKFMAVSIISNNPSYLSMQ